MPKAPEPSSDYYEILNVAKDATNSDIKNAYLKLCLSFHPDKQTDQSLKDASQRIFHVIHTAYTVLSNVKQREIYDKYGIEGIEAAWQLGPHLSDTEKLMEEIEKRKRTGGLLNGEISQIKTTMTLGLDVSEIVDDVIEAQEIVYSDLLPKVSSVGISEVFETSVNADNHLSCVITATGQQGNAGHGSMIFNWKRPLLWPHTVNKAHVLSHVLDRLRYDGSVGIGSRKFLSSAFIYQHDSKTTASLQIAAGLHGGAIFPQLNCSLSRLLHESYSCTMQYSVNSTLERDFSNQLVASLSTKISPDVKGPWTVTAVINRHSPMVEVKKAFPVSDHNEVRVKLNAKRDLSSGLSIGVHHKWNLESRASMAVQMDSETGVALRLGITHGNLNFVLPIQFSHEFSPLAVVTASVLPALGTFVTKSWIRPYIIKKQKELFWDDYMRKRASLIEKRREEAELTRGLMAACLEKKASDGELKITEAIYRCSEDPTLQWTVTIPLQYLLINSPNHLQLEASYRAGVLGFFDVAPGRDKETFIRYQFKNKMHEVVFKDNEVLSIPKRSHIVS